MNMTALTSLPDAIQWSEGMLLSPQHFQQNDNYWQQHLRHRLQALTPHYWGVLQLDCQLINETITISKLECILPDGQLVEFPGRYPRKPEGDLVRNISAECKTGAAPQKIWLLVNPRSANAACQDSKERRYNSIIDTHIADENTGEGGFAIARLQVEFQLHIGVRSPSAEGAVPLCEVVRAANEQLQITPYHPPMLRLDAAAFQGDRSLFKKLNQLHELLWNNSQKLAAQCRHNAHEGDMDPESRQYLMVARALGKCLPQLSILLNGKSHPNLLYEALAEVVGQVSAIGANPLPLLMRPYQHDDCLGQFQAAFDYIESQLTQVDMGHESLVFMRADQHDSSGNNACFERRLLSHMNHALIIELTPRESQTHEQLLRWLKESFIASEALLPHLRRARLPGAKVRALTKQEIHDHKLRPQAALFAIGNQALVFDDKPAVNAFTEGQMLLILGKNNNLTPAAITLHCVKSAVQSIVKNAGGKHG
jgi:type VI secretion system protein ImpJ